MKLMWLSLICVYFGLLAKVSAKAAVFEGGQNGFNECEAKISIKPGNEGGGHFISSKRHHVHIKDLYLTKKAKIEVTCGYCYVLYKRSKFKSQIMMVRDIHVFEDDYVKVRSLRRIVCP
eukprot:TRINITY_DN26008_c0_g1_i12.p1 TRINITY_DN26008_c0_g1~~TRINITY_DN26008_c0_g1_i12.p1  ORF type:complete len:119 (+),score=6.66 TRINITY_DN26008_c0_g1_i12:56-412(+)